MKGKLEQLAHRYSAELRIYVAHGAHGNSLPAIKLGRRLIAIGFETLALTKIHEHALRLLVLEQDSPKVRKTIVILAGKFFSEALAPFEATHRAALNANAGRDRRSAELTTSNRKLLAEIVRRKATELTLKAKEQHVRELLGRALEMQEHLRQLSRDLLCAQEDERKTISRELHDDIAQTLTGINVHLATLKNEAAVNTKGLTRKIANTQRIVKRSVDLVHRFARRLRPTMLDDLGLIPTLHTYMRDFITRTGIRIRFSTFAGIEQLTNLKRTVIYRVIQSALTNVELHAEARHVQVSIQAIAKSAHLKIKDDGKSFEVQAVLGARKNKRLGLLGMRERVEMVGGSFTIESRAGFGTLVEAQIPLNKGMK